MQKTFGGTGIVSINSMDVLDTNEIICSGIFGEMIDFEPNIEENFFTSSFGSNDGFTLKLAQHANSASTHTLIKPLFEIFPNPTSNIINVVGLEVNSAKVLDPTGQTLNNYMSNTLNVADLSVGVYTLLINNTYRVRFIKI